MMQVYKEKGERRDSCRGKGHKGFGDEVEVVLNSRFITGTKREGFSFELNITNMQLGMPHACISSKTNK